MRENVLDPRIRLDTLHALPKLSYAQPSTNISASSYLPIFGGRHIIFMEKIITNASQRAGLLRIMSKDLLPSVSSKLYRDLSSHIRPVLEYCSPVWHGSVSDQQVHALALERIQAGPSG